MDNPYDKLQKRENLERIYVIPSKIIDEIKEHQLASSLHFTDIGCFQNAKFHYRERTNGCEQVILIYCFSGSGYYIFENQKITIQKDSLLLIPENTSHIYSSSEEEPWSILWVHINGSNLKSYYNYLENTILLLKVPFEKQGKIRYLFEDIFDALEGGFNMDNLIYAYQVLANILGFLFYYSNFNQLSIKEYGVSIDESIKYMVESLEKNLTLADLSLHSKLSPTHYSYLFKKHTGFSPINYFLRLKIQKACSFLDLSNYPVNEISSLLGFNDPFYFSRLFHNIMGMSPSEYRNEQKG